MGMKYAARALIKPNADVLNAFAPAHANAAKVLRLADGHPMCRRLRLRRAEHVGKAGFLHAAVWAKLQTLTLPEHMAEQSPTIESLRAVGTGNPRLADELKAKGYIFAFHAKGGKRGIV